MIERAGVQPLFNDVRNVRFYEDGRVFLLDQDGHPTYEAKSEAAKAPLRTAAFPPQSSLTLEQRIREEEALDRARLGATEQPQAAAPVAAPHAVVEATPASQDESSSFVEPETDIYSPTWVEDGIKTAENWRLSVLADLGIIMLNDTEPPVTAEFHKTDQQSQEALNRKLQEWGGSKTQTDWAKEMPPHEVPAYAAKADQIAGEYHVNFNGAWWSGQTIHGLPYRNMAPVPQPQPQLLNV